MFKTLKSYRIDRGLTLRELSCGTGVELSTLSRVERGQQNPSRDTAKSLAGFYAVSIGDIYNGIPSDEAA